MNILNRLFGSSDDDESENQGLVDQLDDLDKRIAQKQAEHEELCKQSDKAKAEVERLERAVKYLDN
jgi:chromosome segregation ATPase